jgi:oxygen-independent coproporphyrinogen-3 oxidase
MGRSFGLTYSATMSTVTIAPPPTTSGPPMQRETTAGNYFVANYPPFAFWNAEAVPAFHQTLDQAPQPGVPLGLYAHIPFCRKRCHFCYFRVYTDKNADDIKTYLDALLKDLASYAPKAVIGGRKPRFIYFGGGTPIYLSPDQLRYLTEGMKRLLPWDEATEITFEAEPGTLTDHKLRAIREMGVTRLSLGIEHFDDAILEINGRAHRSKEVERAYSYAREIGFPQINIDLIAGMVEETPEKWQETVAKAVALEPDSVTIYQMEVPYNTGIYRQMKAEGKLVAPVADWDTKRRWVDEAFRAFEARGYTVTSTTTVVKDPARVKFEYRQGLFSGADLLSIGVASFGHLNQMHYQNHHDFQPYVDAVNAGQLPTHRAYVLPDDERYLREFILQLKLGRVSTDAFTEKFGEDPRTRFAVPLAILKGWGFLMESSTHLELTRDGLLQVDRLLQEFFKPEHRTGRYA